ncbi:hypothetical protein MMC30_002788 [Trapelia coarctata]|nr:hypothetical protein [Trapelia coarctata]
MDLNSDATISASTNMSQSAKDNSLSLLEKIPGEIRNQIYKYLLSIEYATIVQKDTSRYSEIRILDTRHLGVRSYKFHTNICRVNKNIAHESQDYFYHRNRFVRICTNSAVALSCATDRLPVVFQKAAVNFSGHFLDAMIHITSPSSFLGRVADHYQIVLVGKDVPTFIHHLRIAELDWTTALHERSQPTLQVSLRLRTCHEIGHRSDIERSVLAPFEDVVRASKAQVTGSMDFRYAKELANNMIKWLPIGPDVISFCEKIRTECKNAGEDADLQLLHDRYLSILKLVRETLKSRDDARVIGGPETVARLHALTIAYVMELSLVLVKDWTFDVAAGWAKLGVEYLEENIPQCPPQYKARQYFQLALIQMRKVYPDDIMRGINELDTEPRLRPAKDNMEIAVGYLQDAIEFQKFFCEVGIQVYGMLPDLSEPAV